MNCNLTPLLRPRFIKRAVRTDKWTSSGDDVQIATLRNLLDIASSTLFGSKHSFNSLLKEKNLYHAFKNAISPSDYEDIRPLVMRMIQG